MVYLSSQVRLFGLPCSLTNQILYILQRRSLRDKSRGIFSRLLPSLETLDRLGAMSVGGSVISILISAALGYYALYGDDEAEGASPAALW